MLTRSKKLVEAQIALARAETELEHLRATAEEHRNAYDRLMDEKMSLAHKLALAEGAIDEKMLTLSDALERERKLELDLAVYKERLDLVVNHGIGGAEPSGQRLHLTETEEDLEFAVQAGLINKDELEKALEQAGLSNSDITFDFQATRLP